MTKKDVAKLQLGLYRVYWKSGGSSLAAVGNLHDGTRWLAPCNWTSVSPQGIATANYWKQVKYVEKIIS